MKQDAKDPPRDHAAARAATPSRQPDRARLISIGTEELQDLKTARVDGHLKRYRIIETGRKRSIVEVDDDEQVAIAVQVAKSGALVDRNPPRSAQQASAHTKSGREPRNTLPGPRLDGK